MSEHRLGTTADFRRVEVGARAAALVVVLSLSALTGTGRGHPQSLLTLVVLAVLCTLPVRQEALVRWRPVAESFLAAGIVAVTVPYDPALLPYLVIPPLSAGLRGGWRWAVTAAGAGSLALMARGLVEQPSVALSAYLMDAAEWSLLALSVGLLASWVRRVYDRGQADQDSYAEAARLLVQLRDVARQLPVGLDTVVLARRALHEIRAVAHFDRATYFCLAPNGSVSYLLHEGLGRVQWRPELDAPQSPWSISFRQSEPTAAEAGLTPGTGWPGAVLPVRLDEVVGLVGLERRGRPFSSAELRRAQGVLDAAAVRLDAAALFDQLRGIATMEERRRLAREIHDGIAQELASLGYALDDLVARAADAAAHDVTTGLSRLRQELSRVITELRLSIFDLRSEVGPGSSLTSALAENARAVGTASGLTVHLDLAETPHRLRVETEAELLRIAQEAMTNSRRHAQAQNLWVTCHVEPPHVRLLVADDGRGMTQGRTQSFGLSIMHERAARIGAVLSVSERSGGGVVVEVELGGPAQPVTQPVTQPHHSGADV